MRRKTNTPNMMTPILLLNRKAIVKGIVYSIVIFERLIDYFNELCFASDTNDMADGFCQAEYYNTSLIGQDVNDPFFDS